MALLESEHAILAAVTSAPLTLTAPAIDFRGRFVEFLLAGGATLVLFPLAWLLRQSIGLDSAELAVGFLTFHAAHLINDPHFTVTYLLFYKNARQRAFGSEWSPTQRLRYVLAGLVVPLGLLLWAGVALASGSASLLGLMIQLMFLLVGWHYVKQGFGVLSVLSARRGVRFDALERRVILAHCFAGWAYAWASPADPGKLVQENGVVFGTIAHPLWLEAVTQAAFLLSALLVSGVLLRKWRRERRLPPLGPLVALLISVWLWMVYSSLDPLMVYVIPALHSIQYLYFVWLLRRNEARESEGPPRFGRPAPLQVGLLALSAVALGLLAMRGFPALLDAAFGGVEEVGLGPTPYFAAIYTFINIHHYFMDSVIWRRDNAEMRYLLAR
jgi:hypothetical protein